MIRRSSGFLRATVALFESDAAEIVAVEVEQIE